MNLSSDLKKVSIFRKFSPAIKFFAFILLIIFIFIPSGFFSQLILLTFILIGFKFSKISKKTFMNIFKSVVIMFIFLLFINWFSFKMPIAFDTKNSFLLFPTAMNGPIWNGGKNYDPSIYISNIWGGQLYNIDDILEKVKNNEEFIDKANKWCSNINGIDEILSKLPLEISSTDQKVFLYILNNDFVFEGIKYKVNNITNSTEIFKNFNIGFNSAVLYSQNWYGFSPLGIATAISVSIKIWMIILSATLLTGTTTSIELTNGLETLFSPLKIIKFPVNETAMILAITIRFVPSLLSESKRILNAQASRGVDFKNGNIIMKLKSMVSLVVPLFSIAFKKAEDLANAMDARSYNPRYSRTQYRINKISLRDYLLLFILMFIGTIVICFSIFDIIFCPFGILEGFMVA